MKYNEYVFTENFEQGASWLVYRIIGRNSVSEDIVYESSDVAMAKAAWQFITRWNTSERIIAVFKVPNENP